MNKIKEVKWIRASDPWLPGHQWRSGRPLTMLGKPGQLCCSGRRADHGEPSGAIRQQLQPRQPQGLRYRAALFSAKAVLQERPSARRLLWRLRWSVPLLIERRCGPSGG